MSKDNLIEKVSVDCSICSKVHEVEKRLRTTEGLVNGDIVSYEEIYYLCPITDEEENEFVSSLLMDQNLLKAREAYRQCHGLLTSYDTKEVEKYSELSQSEFFNLFGWKDETVTRHENNTIQDITYEDLIRKIKGPPLFQLEDLEKHQSQFERDNYKKIKVSRAYIQFKNENEYNGYRLLDLDKLSIVLNFFAHSVQQLDKVKLMNLLWYTDAIHYKRYGKSMLGLVYRHIGYLVLPMAYDEIIYLPSVKVEEEIKNIVTTYKILPKDELDLVNLSKEEVAILELVARKFSDYDSNEMVHYMYKEKAFIKTEPDKLISYELARELNEF
jgi:hypothetical protein